MELGIACLKDILTEILKLAALLLLSSMTIFFLVSISPIDPLTSNYGQNLTSQMSQEKIAALSNYWGVGKPFLERFFSWLSNALCGSFGDSLIYNEPVLDVIVRGLKNSAPIMAISWFISGLIGYLSAIFVATKNAKGAKVLTLLNYCLTATPTYFLAILFLLIFSVSLNLVPVTSSVSFESSILPCVVLALYGTPTIFFHTKAKCAEVLSSDYVRQAKLNGENTKEITVKHVLKNVSLPYLSIEFAQIGEIIGGSVVVEQVFSYPGLGNITVKAATSSDVCLIAGISFVTCLIVFVGNIICKVIIRAADPRLKNE